MPRLEIIEDVLTERETGRYNWPNQTEPGYQAVSQTITTDITVPDVTGTYHTELGDIRVNMKGIKRNPGGRHRLTLDSELIGGVKTLDVPDGRGGIRLTENRYLRVHVSVPHHPDSGWRGNPI